MSRNQKEEEEEGRCQMMILKTFSLRLRDNMQYLCYYDVMHIIINWTL